MYLEIVQKGTESKKKEMSTLFQDSQKHVGQTAAVQRRILERITEPTSRTRSHNVGCYVACYGEALKCHGQKTAHCLWCGRELLEEEEIRLECDPGSSVARG